MYRFLSAIYRCICHAQLVTQIQMRDGAFTHKHSGPCYRNWTKCDVSDLSGWSCFRLEVLDDWRKSHGAQIPSHSGTSSAFLSNKKKKKPTDHVVKHNKGRLFIPTWVQQLGLPSNDNITRLPASCFRIASIHETVTVFSESKQH